MCSYLVLEVGLDEGEGIAVLSVLSSVSFFVQAHPFNSKATTANAANVFVILMIISLLLSF
jgi:hypothetical protein